MPCYTGGGVRFGSLCGIIIAIICTHTHRGGSYLGTRSERSVFIFVYYTELGMLNFFMYNMARALRDLCDDFVRLQRVNPFSSVVFCLHVQHIAG